MDRTISTVIVVALIALALLGMYLGWRARRRRQSQFPPLAGAPADRGPAILEEEALYVATTVAGDPLNRIAVGGLGYRSLATVTVTQDGVVLSLRGQDPIFIPVDSVNAVGTASWTIDKGVETDGLVALAWRWGEHDVESYLRVQGTEGGAALIEALRTIGPFDDESMKRNEE